jgi:hypothetical protein
VHHVLHRNRHPTVALASVCTLTATAVGRPLRRGCTVEDCTGVHFDKGYCEEHYGTYWPAHLAKSETKPKPPKSEQVWALVTYPGLNHKNAPHARFDHFPDRVSAVAAGKASGEQYTVVNVAKYATTPRDIDDVIDELITNTRKKTP